VSCLEAARLAPSACNGQPWRFRVFAEEFTRRELGRIAFSGIYRSNGFAARAPVLVVALVKAAGLLPRIAGKLQDKHYPLIDLGIACEHFVLQAVELGLGTCWLGWFNQRGVARLLGCSRGLRPAIILSLGYPAGNEAPSPPRLALEEIAGFDSAPYSSR